MSSTNKVYLEWNSNLKKQYNINDRVGSEFSSVLSKKSAITLNIWVFVKGSRTCPGGEGLTSIIQIPGELKFFAYDNYENKHGKLLVLGRTFKECGLERGDMGWVLRAKFTPRKCWRNLGLLPMWSPYAKRFFANNNLIPFSI